MTHLNRLAHIALAQTRRVEKSLYASGVLTKGKTLEDFLHTNRLADPQETIWDVFQRATSFLAQAGAPFYGKDHVDTYQTRFLNPVANFEVILGSPILTNAGRRSEKSISACSIPSIKLSRLSLESIAKKVEDYHSKGMGTGFCLDDVEDPVKMIQYLNELAIKEVQQGKIERSVGNMAVLSVDHPKVLDFIRIKSDTKEVKEWKFNLSVNLPDTFMHALMSKTPYRQSDGTLIDPNILMNQIAKNAHETGDPGIIFMDKINQLNRTPQAGKYRTVVPCGEVSLFDGEVCQFAYLNMARFVTNDQQIDRKRLQEAIHSTVILLDNAVEANIEKMPYKESANIISSVRRIGIGLCGFAEVLHSLHLPYDSPEGRSIGADLMSFIQYESKRASIELAKTRGPFPLFDHPETRKELFIAPFKKHPTRFVSKEMWEDLEQEFQRDKIRNIATTILPPTGRSSIFAGVSSSIEPPFRLSVDPALKESLSSLGIGPTDLESAYEMIEKRGSIQQTNLPERVKEIFKTALEISLEGHLNMTATFQRFIDEGISKTVNLSHNVSPETVAKIFVSSYNLGLKGITIYRDGCRTFQPKALNMQTESSSNSTIIDPIYGPIQISPRIAQLLTSPMITRLKKIHQNGVNFLIDPRQSTSRFEHSVGTLALVQMLGGNESIQIAALLHDISHTAFSHLIDLVFATKEQNYHSKVREQVLKLESTQKTIAECALSPEEIESDSHTLIKGEKTGLNVDRLDYYIRDLRATNRLYHPQYSSILNQLVIGADQEIACKNLDTARLLFEKVIEANEKIYFDPKAEAAAIVMTVILQKMLQTGWITENDLLSSDDDLLAKINSSPYQKIYEEIGPNMEFSQSDTPTHLPPALRKKRFVNPKIVGLPGRLTDHCERSKKLLDSYLKTPDTVYYNIPILKNALN